jgi:hypothetical protein
MQAAIARCIDSRVLRCRSTDSWLSRQHGGKGQLVWSSNLGSERWRRDLLEYFKPQPTAESFRPPLIMAVRTFHVCSGSALAGIPVWPSAIKVNRWTTADLSVGLGFFVFERTLCRARSVEPGKCGENALNCTAMRRVGEVP